MAVLYYVGVKSAEAPKTVVEPVATTTPIRETVQPSLVSLDVKPWKWVSVTYRDGASTTPKTDVFAVTFNSSGGFTAETDCNGISGSYEARNGNISLGSIVATEMFCEESEESLFVELLSKIIAYEFTEGGQLRMKTSDGSQLLFR
jgi:heat shock protein HslJ